MIIYNNRGSEKIPIPVLKINDFNKFIIALESIFLDFWYLFNQSVKTKCVKVIPEIVEILYTIVRIRTPIEARIYKKDFSWKDINKYLYNKICLTITLEDSNNGLLYGKEEVCWFGIDDYILEVQLEFINKLHDSEKIFIEDLIPLQEKKLKPLNDSCKDHLYEMALINLEFEYFNLSLEELGFITILIDKALELKNDKDLEDARNISNGYIKAFYSQIDYII